MNKIIIVIPSIIVFLFIVFLLLVVTQPVLDGFMFEKIPYNYTMSAVIPSNSDDTASLNGFFNVNGIGKNFNFHMMLPGAEKAESPLDYTSNGISGNGKINNLNITFDSIKSIITLNLVNAAFNTQLSGVFNMSCAAWIGNGTFVNNGKNFTGNFTINGQETNYLGNYSLQRENNHIIIISDYSYWHAYRNDYTPTYVHNIMYL
jgi:hypothetical protein